uniref:Heterogeneous nuclear ribonucleoprotein L n=1 Tax=Schizaphis graminum TaxID=13262 RepID=A0A2S2NCW6_SCHGA
MMSFNHYGYNSLKNEQTNKRLRTADYDRESRTTNSSVSYEDGRRKNAETQPNHILLLTITKVTYPINTDVIHTISKDHGNVLRIVIFRKRGVQAMVEYEEVEQAIRAKQLMDGADIYQGCCTLRVEYAKPSKLNVYKNDSETWDYTTPNPGEKKTAPLLPDPPRAPLISTRPTFPRFDFECRGGLLSTPHDLPNNNYGDSYPATPGRCVLMVYGLDPDKANCNRLFNLFCLYGNVVKIKFLKSKEGCAMVQMDNEICKYQSKCTCLTLWYHMICLMALHHSKIIPTQKIIGIIQILMEKIGVRPHPVCCISLMLHQTYQKLIYPRQ